VTIERRFTLQLELVQFFYTLYVMAVVGYSSYIASCAFSAFLIRVYPEYVKVIVKIHATRKILSLPKPLKDILLSLAFSDLGVGLLVQPEHIAVHVMRLEPNAENNTVYKGTFLAYLTLTNLFGYGSFFGVMAVTVLTDFWPFIFISDTRNL